MVWMSLQAMAVTTSGQGSYLCSKVCFDQVNAQGGMNGQWILFVLDDDQYKPEEVMRLVGAVAWRHRPVAILKLLGSTKVAATVEVAASEAAADIVLRCHAACRHVAQFRRSFEVPYCRVR